MLQRRDRFAVLGTGLLLALTAACGGSGGSGDDGRVTATKEPGTAAPATQSPAAGPAEVPAGWRRHDGTGFTLALPPSWQTIDPTAHGARSVRRSFGLEGGELPELVEVALGELKKHGAVFAIETATEQASYANHLQAVCGPGGIVGNDLEALRRKAQALNKDSRNLRITDVTVGGRQGLRISYTSTGSNGVTQDTIEIQVPGTGDDVCEVAISTAPGSPAKEGEQILATFRLT
ncbi:hypothetical protein [Thermomonospora cellulosilytica]|uniref:Lipoprotein n=1 Tax=Thermomonospora cellulosilytica TaxID=1411118 RepID=A0A7W3MTR7_9ACTN|nr:hypothetical protein [Thermomonospora cellulosilytica]MBA9001735.1 hypothetical protein [Thermomonospora cellulosilytica]